MNTINIWSSNKHAAFTDLIRHGDAWYCVFREGTTHMSLDGNIIVLQSNNAQEWQEHSRLSFQGADLRDPKLSIDPANRLILSAGIRWAVPNTSASKLYSVAWVLNADKLSWLEPIMDATSQGTWRWAITWHQGIAYSVGYSGADLQGCLYRSLDGLHWEAWVKPFFPKAKVFTNESSLVSDGGRLLCLTRRDAAGGANAVLGQSDGDCKNWNWRQLSLAIGGPKLLKLSNREYVMAVRRINYQHWRAKTRLYKVNPDTGRLKLWHTLSSGGDCSYAGMVEQEGKLYISYYSSHENDQPRIYLAVIPLKTKHKSLRYR